MHIANSGHLRLLLYDYFQLLQIGQHSDLLLKTLSFESMGNTLHGSINLQNCLELPEIEVLHFMVSL